MVGTIDRPPETPNAPPPLPPYLERRGGGGGKIKIIPSLLHSRIHSKTLDPDKEFWTYHYVWMVRVNTKTAEVEGPVHRDSRTYRRWLETYHPDPDIPPHIVFGGFVKPTEHPDEGAHKRWIDFVKECFA